MSDFAGGFERVSTEPRTGERSRYLTTAIWLLLWLVVFSSTLAWRAQNLDAFGLSNDEGAHLMWARLAVDGYPLYGETQAVQAPLFLEWVALAFRLAGQTIQVGRWAILMGFGLLAISLSWLAYRYGGWLAAITAILLLGLAPLNFTLSRLVLAEVPATGFAVLSVALLFLFLDTTKRVWLWSSGLALGLSFITKALNPFVVVPIGLLLLLPSRSDTQDKLKSARRHRPLLDGLIWSTGLAVPLILPWFIYDPAAMYDQLIAFRSDLRAALPGSWSETRSHFTTFFTTHWGIWLLACGGLISPFLRLHSQQNPNPANKLDKTTLIPTPIKEPTQTITSPLILHPSSFILHPLIWFVWLIAGLAMLLWHTPLFAHHFVVLLPPLILLGAGFIADIVNSGQAATQNSASQPAHERASSNTPSSGHAYGPIALLSLIVVVAAFNLPAMVEANQHTAAIVTGGREARALELLQAVSNPDDFLMGDSQLLIFMAGRRTPPPLGDVALVAIKAGRQTSARMIDLTQTYDAPAVVQWSLRLPWLPEYLDWVEANYLARRTWDGDHIIYFAPRFSADRPIPNERMASLGDHVVLRGFDIDQESPEAGRTLNLSVYWETKTPLPEDYTVFTQLLDSQGTLVAGWDGQPLGGYFPTSQWPPDEIITNLVHLPLPADLPAGRYTLITGMYLLDTLERLPASTGSDHLILTTLALPE